MEKEGQRRKGHLQPRGSSACAIRIVSSDVITNVTSLWGNVWHSASLQAYSKPVLSLPRLNEV